MIAGRESAGSYLARREPTYEVGRWIDSHLPAGARLVGQDHRGFYLPPGVRDGAGPPPADRPGDDMASRPGRSSRRSAGRGFTHVLLCPPVPEDAVEFDPTLGGLLAPWLASARPIYRRDLADADGVVRRYAIHDLTDREAWR